MEKYTFNFSSSTQEKLIDIPTDYLSVEAFS
jgi:hypothetical protein